MGDNLVYKEVFERSGINTYEEAEYKINSVKEAHPSEYGWVAKECQINKQEDGKYKVIIPLEKYEVKKARSR